MGESEGGVSHFILAMFVYLKPYVTLELYYSGHVVTFDLLLLLTCCYS